MVSHFQAEGFDGYQDLKKAETLKDIHAGIDGYEIIKNIMDIDLDARRESPN